MNLARSYGKFRILLSLLFILATLCAAALGVLVYLLLEDMLWLTISAAVIAFFSLVFFIWAFAVTTKMVKCAKNA